MEKLMSNNPKQIVVIGVDAQTSTARAARFDANQEPAVRKAAGLMNFRVGCLDTEKATTLAAKLSEENVLEGDLATIPPIVEALYWKLLKVLTFDSTWNTAGIIAGSLASLDRDAVKAADTMSAALKVGNTVLCFDGSDPLQFGWSAAVIISMKNGELELVLRDWPNNKPFIADRRSVALLPAGNTKLLRS
jgi:hypothetical protein